MLLNKPTTQEIMDVLESTNHRFSADWSPGYVSAFLTELEHAAARIALTRALQRIAEPDENNYGNPQFIAREAVKKWGFKDE